VEQNQLLLAMSRIIDRIDIKSQMLGWRSKGSDELVDEHVAQPFQGSDVDGILET
jgi:hypothetical protein